MSETFSLKRRSILSKVFNGILLLRSTRSLAGQTLTQGERVWGHSHSKVVQSLPKKIRQLKIPSDECVGVILDFILNSTAKTLAIYREFWYFSRIFPTLFSQLISIFISLLHTFSMGVKTDARLPRSERFASIMRSRVLSASCGTRRRIRTITKMGVSRFEHYEFVDLFQPRGSAHFFSMALIRLRLPEGAEKRHYA